MELIHANTAGFSFGVKRAVEMAERFAESGAELDALSAGTFTTCLAEKTPSP